MGNKQKIFFENGENFTERIIKKMGYCLASDRITVDGLKVGYMYRENPDDVQDSGWRFFAGDEDDNYANNPENVGIYDVNTIAHYDSDVIPFLDSSINTAFGRNEEGIFEEEFFDSELTEED